jgi:hypothetical protein
MCEARTAWSYFASIILGGFAGAMAIIMAVIAELDWECKYWNRGYYDGRGG